MNLIETMEALAALGSEQTRKVLSRHGAIDFYGVKISDIKKLIRKTGKDHNLALELYRTGISDAMYMAGLMVDPCKLSQAILEEWVDEAYWYMLSEVTVAGAAAESRHGLDLARRWIESPSAQRASSGWSIWCNLLAMKSSSPDLDFDEILGLIKRVESTIHSSSNRVRYCMNSFIIAAGSFRPDLTERAYEAAETIGEVKVSMGETSCKVPDACSYIKKVEALGKIGNLRKRVLC